MAWASGSTSYSTMSSSLKLWVSLCDGSENDLDFERMKDLLISKQISKKALLSFSKSQNLQERGKTLVWKQQISIRNIRQLVNPAPDFN